MITILQINDHLKNLEILMENISKLKKVEIEDELKKIYLDFKSLLNVDEIIQVSDSSNEDVEELENYKSQLYPIIQNYMNDVKTMNYSEKPIRIDFKRYTELIISKLNIIFRKQQIVLQSHAESLCLNPIYLEKKYHTFISLIEWINDNGISILIDRILFCSYLNISYEAYDNFLNSPDETIKSIFSSIENMYISQKLNASEIGTRSSNAIRTNLSYSKVGAGLTPKDNAPNLNGLNKVLTVAEIMRKAQALGYEPTPEENIIEAKYKEN